MSHHIIGRQDYTAVGAGGSASQLHTYDEKEGGIVRLLEGRKELESESGPGRRQLHALSPGVAGICQTQRRAA